MSVTAYSKTHTLRWPIVDDKGQQLTALNIHTLSLRTVRELRAEYGLVDGASDGASDAVLMKFEKALLLRSTGLSDRVNTCDCAYRITTAFCATYARW